MGDKKLIKTCRIASPLHQINLTFFLTITIFPTFFSEIGSFSHTHFSDILGLSKYFQFCQQWNKNNRKRKSHEKSRLQFWDYELWKRTHVLLHRWSEGASARRRKALQWEKAASGMQTARKWTIWSERAPAICDDWRWRRYLVLAFFTSCRNKWFWSLQGDLPSKSWQIWQGNQSPC